MKKTTHRLEQELEACFSRFLMAARNGGPAKQDAYDKLMAIDSKLKRLERLKLIDGGKE